MYNVFRRFVEHLHEGQKADDLRVAMVEAATVFDLPCFAYAYIPSSAKKTVNLISTYSVRWTDHYLSSHYEILDPVISAAYQSVEPFEWGQDAGGFNLNDRQKEFFEEASNFGIRCGFTIPMRDGHGSIAAVTFASSERRSSFIRSIRMNMRTLQLMAASFHHHASRKLWRSRVVNGIELTPREFECLIWAARGKSAWATAEILGISDATVRFHLGHVRAKLDVATTRQAIAALDVQTHLP